MAAMAVIQIEQDLKTKAEKIFAEEGISIADAVRMLLLRAVRENSVPLDLFTPNAETVAAMEAGRRGEFTTVGSADELFAHLHADD